MTAEKRALRFVLIALGLLVAVVVAINMLNIPELDKDTLCPKDPIHISAGDLNILVDRTDPLSALNEEIVRSLVDRWSKRARAFQRMHLYVLKSGDIKVFSKQLTVCAPPLMLSLQIALGRTQATALVKQQNEYIRNAITQGIETTTLINRSRIIEAVRQITNATWLPHSKLLIISDLIEISDLADFYYSMAPTFSDWKQKPNAAAILREVMLTKDNKVQICELHTDKPSYAHRGAARTFWQQFFNLFGIAVEHSCSEIAV